MNFREEAHLMHFGVLGMKWGQRKGPSNREQTKSSKYIDRVKSIHGVKAQERNVEWNKKSYIKLKKIGPKYYGKSIGIDDDDVSSKDAYEYELANYKRKYKAGKIMLSHSKILEQKLSSIDITASKYKDVKKQVNTMLNDMLNNSINEELEGG